MMYLEGLDLSDKLERGKTQIKKEQPLLYTMIFMMRKKQSKI